VDKIPINARLKWQKSMPRSDFLFRPPHKTIETYSENETHHHESVSIRTVAEWQEQRNVRLPIQWSQQLLHHAMWKRRTSSSNAASLSTRKRVTFKKAVNIKTNTNELMIGNQ
jgi:hypothetical protein